MWSGPLLSFRAMPSSVELGHVVYKVVVVGLNISVWRAIGTPNIRQLDYRFIYTREKESLLTGFFLRSGRGSCA